MIEFIKDFIKNNQFVAGILGLYSAGILTFFFHKIPAKIFGFVEKNFTTNLTVTSSHMIFYQALKWFDKKLSKKNYRTIKLSNGRYGQDRLIKSIGYGRHFIFYKKSLLLVHLISEKNNESDRDKEIINIIKFGRSHKVFDKIIAEFMDVEKDNTVVKVFYRNHSSWEFAKAEKKRYFSTVMINKNIYRELITRLNSFIDNENWYIENGINYQLGILLYGPPGTGKTSIIKCIASYSGFDIYYLSPAHLKNIDEIVPTLPPKSLLVIEDIDSSTIAHQRKSTQLMKNDVVTENAENILDDYRSMGLSDCLNALDGLLSSHGRCLIATTNHIEKLDSALLRPGRFDLKIKIDYPGFEEKISYLKRFYTLSNEHIEAISQTTKTATIADFQNYMLSNYSIEKIIEEIK